MTGARTDSLGPARLRAARAWVARQPRRNLLLCLLLPVLIVAWLPILGGGKSPVRPVANPPAELMSPAPVGEVAGGSSVVATIAATGEFEHRVRALTQPFRPRWGAELPAQAEPAPTADPNGVPSPVLVPSAILLSQGGEPMVIVQGRAYRTGESIAGRTIVSIEERRVVYREGTRTFAAAMGGAALGGQR